MNFKIAPTTILLSFAGSHAYGMNQPTSDIDVRGICVAPFDIRISINNHFEQYEGEWPFDFIPQKSERNAKLLESKPDDVVIFDIAKAINLIGNCNPNMLELLFSNEEDYILLSPMGEKLLENKNKFLTLKIKHTYTGYAVSQLKKIERHRKYLMGTIPKKPSRTEFGLPEHESLIPSTERNLIDEEIKKRIRDWTADNIEINPAERVTLHENMRSFMAAAIRASDHDLDDKIEDVAAESLGFDQDIREILRRERGFRTALKEFKSYERWESDRNPKRKELEERHGFDTKHASHLIRLVRSGTEILEYGELRVRRKDAEELLAIRRGERNFEDIKEESDRLLNRMDDLYKENPQNLPKKPDSKFLEQINREIILMSLR